MKAYQQKSLNIGTSLLHCSIEEVHNNSPSKKSTRSLPSKLGSRSLNTIPWFRKASFITLLLLSIISRLKSCKNTLYATCVDIHAFHINTISFPLWAYCRSMYVRCYKCSCFSNSEHFVRY